MEVKDNTSQPSEIPAIASKPKTHHGLILFGLALFFLLLTSRFNYTTQAPNFIKWLSPDETANYTFARLYAQTGDLRLFEKFNPLVSEIIHPRSFRSDNGYLKPVSFLGISLIYGRLAVLTSVDLIPYFTPIFGALAIVFFYLLVRELFKREVAIVAAGLLTFFPPFIYYTSRSLFHNVLFISLLIIGFYFSVMMLKFEKIMSVRSDDDRELKKKTRLAEFTNLRSYFIYPSLAGFFLGLAIITRTSELIWLGPVLFLFWLANIRLIGVVKLVFFICFILLAATPALNWNRTLYGSPWSSGYPEMNASIATLSAAGGELVKTTIDADLVVQKQVVAKIKKTLFYFGLDYRKSLKVFFYYFFDMFNWLFWLATAGIITFFVKFREIKARQAYFLFLYLIASTILLFYYGSWDFHDNPDPAQFTIGNSYARYWLPIYLGAIIFAAFFIVQLTSLAKNKVWIASTRVFLVAVIAIISLDFVFFGSAEGLQVTAINQQSARKEFKLVLEATEGDSVIITRYHDKLLFPERKVIVGLFDDDAMNRAYRTLVGLMPVYYYNFTFPKKDFDYLNRSKLPTAGLNIKKIRPVTKDFTLYKLIPFATSTPATTTPK